MDETLHGVRDRRGHWRPNAPIEPPPLFVAPFRPLRALRWVFGVPGYLLPYNLPLLAIALASWFWLTPPVETMAEIAPGWIALLLLRNAGLVLVVFGAAHLWLYVRRAQGTTFKYNPNWPATDNGAFLFRDQTTDNLIWTFASGVPIWTAWEALTLHAFAAGWIPWLAWADSPLGFAALLLAIPLFREAHFYVVHRALHWPPLYRRFHKTHHANVNPGPWSSLAMHPVEHLAYFSGVLLHWIVPSHPLHAMFHLQHAALGAVIGHIGFDKVVTGEDGAIDTETYTHYLHHKYFEVNYADGLVPFDRIFGTWHDGTAEADERMRARRRTPHG